MTNFRVLFIEREPEAAERISALLSRANHTVFATSSLQEAFEALGLEKFDAVLLGASVPLPERESFATGLRHLERRQAVNRRTPALLLSPHITADQGWAPGLESNIDGYLAERFEPDTLAAAIQNLSRANAAPPDGDEQQPVFVPEEFRDQCVNEPQLMVEIINLFLAEQGDQLLAMSDALAGSRFEHLARTAHTIKGSLAALHAMRARHRAQILESAAKEKDEAGCQAALLALEEDLEELKPVLAAFHEQTVAN
ncbi:MAG: Hpt domain-containing protein [Acidobacteriaceae bacterium]|nr:Hpt domain-containing protein [Acidobacteriaceae bacterium]